MSRFEGRRTLHWGRIKGPRESIALAIATAGGAGLLPKAPGTFGTAVGVGIAFLSAGWSTPERILLWSALFIAGCWASTVVDETMGTDDNQNIVMDEVVGLGITAWTIGTHPWGLLTSFVVFRFFDIVKPPPVRQIDHWSHRRASQGQSGVAKWVGRWVGGFGVMADDAAAGFLGLVVMLTLQYFGFFS